MPCVCFIFSIVSLIRVRVLSPKKSIFSSPALSTTELSNWVTNRSESLAKATGTKLVISSGVIITPQAWIPVLRTEPSIILACWIVWLLSSSPPPAKSCLSSSTLGSSSLRTFSLSFFSSQLKRFFSESPGGLEGTKPANRFDSCRGTSSTRAVSFIADLAAILP